MIDDAHAPSRGPRRGPLGSAAILAALALFCVHIFLKPYPHPVAVGTAAALALAALAWRAWWAMHVPLLLLLIPATARLWPTLWPFWLLGPLAAWAVAAVSVPPLRRSVRWLRLGRMTRATWCLVGATGIASGLALWLWFVLLRPDLHGLARRIPRWQGAALVAGGAAFALINAAMEEGVWRGVLMDGLDSVFGPGHVSVVVQAISFGLVHFHGIPNGWLGVAMATVYGVLLGYLRRLSNGMLAPFIAHVLADAAIFAMLMVRLGHP